jgi:ATP:ADP antiporter, AAA family
VYLHVSGLGPMLGSGFWLVATERFDPRTAKLRFGQIAGIGTLGGLVGGLVAERVAVVLGVSAMLPVLAALNLVCAVAVRALVRTSEVTRERDPVEASPELAAEMPRTGFDVLARAPYLRSLSALVILGTIGAAIVDYVFKAQAVAALGRGDDLLRFFAAYYTVTSLAAFLVQTTLSRSALERLGLAFVVSTPSMALLAGGLGSLVAPGLASALVARGGESMFRASLFRSGYELFYTPVPPRERRAAKSLIDVGFDRLGDAIGGGMVRSVLLLAPAAQMPTLMGLSMACALGAILVASRLNRGYLKTLERSLLDRAVELDLGDIKDFATRTVVLQTMHAQRGHAITSSDSPGTMSLPLVDDSSSGPLSRILSGIAVLTSRDRAKITALLRGSDGLPATLVPHVVPLLAWDAVADDALFALRKVSEERIGMLIDALIDPNQEFAVRRRLARAFSLCVSQRAVDGLFLGLDDMRFEVRYQCGRSLAAIRERNPLVRITRERTLEVVSREVAVSRPVWESHRLLDQLEDNEPRTSFDDYIKDRTSQSLGHVFTLLSLVLPPDPLRVAYLGLRSHDWRLRGTSLEYLEEVLPPGIRERLWPFLDAGRPATRGDRPREEILAELLRMNESVAMNLSDLREGRTGADGSFGHPGAGDQSKRVGSRIESKDPEV